MIAKTARELQLERRVLSLKQQVKKLKQCHCHKKKRGIR